MKITLETVRQILREALGFDSFTAGFISSVEAGPTHPTAGITKEGRLCYNPAFVQEYVTCGEDLFSLVFHELLHPLFGHFVYRGGLLENIAADAIINAAISTLYTKASRGGALFKKTHSPKGLDGIMRPYSQMTASRYERVYNRLYNSVFRYNETMTTGELIQSLRILVDLEKAPSVLLLGTHGGGRGTSETAPLPCDVLSGIAEDIQRSIRNLPGRQAGYSQDLLDMFLEALRTHLSIRRALLQNFATKRKVDRFKQRYQIRRIATSPVPIHPSKRDMVLIAAGIYPCHFHNQLQRSRIKRRGLAIYLDVSGSVDTYLPKILGVLKNLENEITSVLLFSNKVVEIPFSTLLQGKIRTTYGTDFNCIAESILERGYDKAVIVTDGCASMKEELSERLKQRGLCTLTILFDRAESCKDFAAFGDVVFLDEICR